MSLVQTINQLCIRRLQREPNLESPEGYNDKIQWLKVYDQTELHKAACDKLKARDIAAARVGSHVLVPLLYQGRGMPALPYPYVCKTNHDSGTVVAVRHDAGFNLARQRVTSRIGRVYGLDRGEWGYWFIEPKVMAEALMPEPVTDYKFHCVHGRPRWVQVIRDRASGKPKETILGPDGKVMPLHMDHKMVHDPDQGAYPGDEAWQDLTDVAEALAEGWRYVRVDLYFVRSGPLAGVRFGELTFWPLSGCYKSKDEPVFGEMLDINLSYRLGPIVS